MIVDDGSDLFHGLSQNGSLRVWMSHGDRMNTPPRGWKDLAHASNSPLAAFANGDRRLCGVQFHPEVAHTPRGKEILDNFLFRICGCKPAWTMSRFVESAVEKIREKVDQGRVLCALSGGVDSSAVGTLVHRTVGER